MTEHQSRRNPCTAAGWRICKVCGAKHAPDGTVWPMPSGLWCGTISEHADCHTTFPIASTDQPTGGA